MAKAANWTGTDAEVRKRGEQTGLDTLVVHAVNSPLSNSRLGVLKAVPGLSPGISPPTFQSAYARFTPSNSEQR